MKIFKQTLMAIFSALVTMTLVYGGYTIYAEEAELDFRQPNKGIDFVENTYHQAMNQYFNNKLTHLVEILEDANFAEHPDFLAPKSGQICGEKNVSTYCVAMGATDMYIDLLKTLDQINGSLLIKDGDISIDDALISTSKQDTQIAGVIEESQIVLDGTLASYNEFRLAYPMHKQYELVINNLVNYKKSLESVRNDISRFPSKFIDASSSYCK